ncbi:ATP11 protein-domain-containing protein [Syncephalastrum racemosum]|uniref:ATP11 protein-domain-containing protein n=1 Tax=Syncephalastrum racemosum TaxID=13706 RepID=A0A1X2H3T0_SYNRA|nr:ATP11 protein-domain-containing protein [Syncephalastrum racemosum]
MLRQCASLAQCVQRARFTPRVLNQCRQAEVVSLPSSVFYGQSRFARVRQIATEANRVKIDYDTKYANKLKEAAKKRGVTVEELKTKLQEEAQQEAKRKAQAAEVRKAELEAQKAKQQQKAVDSQAEAVKASAQKPYESSAPTLDKIVKLELFEKENPETIEKIWTDFHADKDCITAVIPKGTYDTLFQRSQKYPMFIVPMPREAGIEFFFMQFIFHQCHFTSLLEYKAKGTEARPFLTITHFPELADSKGIVLMKGEISDNPRMIDTQNAQFLAFALQQFYATGAQSKFELVEKFHRAPHEFDYQELINEIERVV